MAEKGDKAQMETTIDAGSMPTVERKVSKFQSGKDKRIVYCQLNLTRIGEINTLEQTFRGKFQFDCYWVATEEEKKQWDDNGADEQNWVPSWIPNQRIMRLSNSVDVHAWEIMLDTKARDIVLLDRWGKWMWRRRFIIDGTFSEEQELQSFPFDIQNFSIVIQAVEYITTWEFQPLPDGADAFVKLQRKHAPLTEWKLVNGCCEFHATDPSDSLSGAQYSLITLDVKCVRRWQVHFYSVVLPIAILSLAALAAFAIPIEESTEGRLSYAISLSLVVVAYQLIISSSLPQIAYLTWLDKYIMVFFIFTLVMIGQTSVVWGLYNDVDERETADTYCAYAFWLAWLILQIGFSIYARKAQKSELHKMGMTTSEINQADAEDKKTLLISKDHKRNTKFGYGFFYHLPTEEDDTWY